ncbi:MAG: NADH-quinone oxidoreductase subunit C [Nitrospirae bacterium]|nr:NADH-quinone oxidoreductase subunit C [Nitrospirota bacterium]
MGTDEIVERIKSRFPDDVLSVTEFRGQTGITIHKKNLLAIAGFLKNEADLNFDLLRDLCGADYLNKRAPRFEVVYQLYSIKNKHCIRLNVQVSQKDTHIKSVTSLWIGANWHERECFDLFGIVFDGHPDLRRILMPEDWEGHPLRKDYPVEGPAVEWKGYDEVLKKTEEYKQYQWYR